MLPSKVLILNTSLTVMTLMIEGLISMPSQIVILVIIQNHLTSKAFCPMAQNLVKSIPPVWYVANPVLQIAKIACVVTYVMNGFTLSALT